MVYKLEYTKQALKDLERLSSDQIPAILKKLDFIMLNQEPLLKAKKLKNFKSHTYRFRVGDYRIIFRKDVKTKKLIVLLVLKIAHRKRSISEKPPL